MGWTAPLSGWEDLGGSSRVCVCVCVCLWCIIYYISERSLRFPTVEGFELFSQQLTAAESTCSTHRPRTATGSDTQVAAVCSSEQAFSAYPFHLRPGAGYRQRVQCSVEEPHRGIDDQALDEHEMRCRCRNKFLNTPTHPTHPTLWRSTGRPP